MNTPAWTYPERRTLVLSKLADYLELTKPRIAVLVLVTVAVAAYIGSWSVISPMLYVHTLLGTALVAASASALNQLIERNTDAKMNRTADRPLPAGRLSQFEVLTFGLITISVGIVYLMLAVNLTTACLGLLTWILYVLFYTPLKTRTPFNTVVGAVAGAMPVLIGWAAVDGSFWPSASGLKVATLFMIVYLWQFPHFMAIAWIYRKQYGDAGLQMLTVVDPSGQRAGLQAVLASLALLPIVLLPGIHNIGLMYLIGVIVLGLVYVYYSINFLFNRNDAAARRLLHASLIYLPAVMALFIVSPLV
ncbi:MAG: heme o synthase [Planctomycetota bacterium]|nr:heme o synthase [Planctomycetota bacterium]